MQGPVTPLAADPREGVVRQPRNEIVTPRFIAVPPAALDALRAAEQREFRFRHAAPFLEQPQRARTRLPVFARIPFTRLDAPPRMLRPVIRLRGEAADPSRAKPRAQPLEE